MAIFPTPAPCPCPYRGVYERDAKSFPHASAAARLLIFRMVERLQPVASWIMDQLIPRSSMSEGSSAHAAPCCLRLRSGEQGPPPEERFATPSQGQLRL